jgi:ABC-type sugar transport system ATPase subunit
MDAALTTAETAALLAARGVSKYYGALAALEDVDFDVKSGEIHALIGENGAGKSTLVSLLSGGKTPDEGAIELGDGSKVTLTPDQALRAGIRIIHQERQLCTHLSVAENIHLGTLPTRRVGSFGIVDAGAMRTGAEDALGLLGVKLDVNVAAADLTRADQQVVELAKAIHEDARVLLMDEPTAALGHREAANLLALIDRLRASGTGIVFISHDLGEVARIADRVTVLRDGRSLGTYDARECTAEELAELMVGKVERSARPSAAVESDGDPVLDVSELSTAGVADVSLTLRRGEVLGLTGLLGAGHIEVAQAIFGAQPLEAGVIKVRGEVKSFHGPADACAAGIGLVPPDRKTQGLLRDLSIAENTTLAKVAKSRKYGLSRSWMTRTARAALAPFAVKAGSLDAGAFSLSGGNQQKVVFGKWSAAGADVLILAEPTSGIDVKSKEDIILAIDRLVRGGTAVLVVSTDVSEIERLAGRALVMRRGRIVAELSGSDVTAARLGAIASA